MSSIIDIKPIRIYLILSAVFPGVFCIIHYLGDSIG